jgi:serine-type D-Ala-D-Ala carboxypeptidase (penicillin-binding protein 5/6)
MAMACAVILTGAAPGGVVCARKPIRGVQASAKSSAKVSANPSGANSAQGVRHTRDHGGQDSPSALQNNQVVSGDNQVAPGPSQTAAMGSTGLAPNSPPSNPQAQPHPSNALGVPGSQKPATPALAPSLAPAPNPPTFASRLMEMAPLKTIVPYGFVYDVTGRTTLLAKNADQPCAPSSMTKVMLLHMLFQLVKSRQFAWTDMVTISEHAAKQGGSRMFLKIGQQVSLHDLALGVSVSSGNDAATALAEHIAGSEEICAQMMTDQAAQLGCKNTRFLNASGLPQPGHQSTVRDLGIIACATLQDFKREYLYFYARTEHAFNGIKQPNRNRLLRDKTADGMKTGFTESGGYGIIASAERHGRRVVVVINGAPTDGVRVAEARRLLNWSFQAFTHITLYSANTPISQVKVWRDKPILAVSPQPITLTMPKTAIGQARVIVRYSDPLLPPVRKGQHVGDVLVVIKDVALRFPLVSSEDRSGSFWEKIRTMISPPLPANKGEEVLKKAPSQEPSQSAVPQTLPPLPTPSQASPI